MLDPQNIAKELNPLAPRLDNLILTLKTPMFEGKNQLSSSLHSYTATSWNVYVHTHMHTYVHTHIHMYTHTYTQRQTDRCNFKLFKVVISVHKDQ